MVGTVLYMPPEQAMGGEVTGKADLYPLGAMLYEMVCGRPPFLGDDSVAIIGQHINTPPVAPTWHNSSCPKLLEALILRLLAKDPAERPDSASDVLTALEGVDLSAGVEEPSGASVEANVLDSLAGGVFVGRQREMGELKAALEEALSGRGRLVTLVGEPPRTAQELATYAGLRGAQVIWGQCYEEQGVPSYWPWVQTIRSYVREREQPDVIAESFTPKVMRNWGLDYESVREIKPDIVYFSTCLQSQTGPRALYAGYGQMAAALAGFHHITGWPDRDPTGPHGAYFDFINPLNAVAAIIAALDYRRRTGKGQHLDLAQYEAAIQYLSPAIADCVVNGRGQVSGRQPRRDAGGPGQQYSRGGEVHGRAGRTPLQKSRRTRGQPQVVGGRRIQLVVPVQVSRDSPGPLQIGVDALGDLACPGNQTRKRLRHGVIVLVESCARVRVLKGVEAEIRKGRHHPVYTTLGQKPGLSSLGVDRSSDGNVARVERIRKRRALDEVGLRVPWHSLQRAREPAASRS